MSLNNKKGCQNEENSKCNPYEGASRGSNETRNGGILSLPEAGVG